MIGEPSLSGRCPTSLHTHRQKQMACLIKSVESGAFASLACSSLLCLCPPSFPLLMLVNRVGVNRGGDGGWLYTDGLMMMSMGMNMSILMTVAW